MLPELSGNDIVIDGLFGSGLNRPLGGAFTGIVRFINSSAATVVSVDMPSGLFGEDNRQNDTGNIINADLTLTFGFPKLAFLFPENEKYVGECINSVINQTYTNLEILINNDGSTDNSYQICQSYAQIDPRIKLYSQENKGVSIARNAMLEKAIGEYVLFIDPDDFILPTHVERLLNLLNEYDAVLLPVDT